MLTFYRPKIYPHVYNGVPEIRGMGSGCPCPHPRLIKLNMDPWCYRRQTKNSDYASIIGSAIWSRFGKAVKIEQGLQGRDFGPQFQFGALTKNLNMVPTEKPIFGDPRRWDWEVLFPDCVPGLSGIKDSGAECFQNGAVSRKQVA